MLNALRLAGRSGGIEEAQRVLSLNPLRLTIRRGIRDDLVPPDIARSIHGNRLVSTAADDDALDARTTASQCLVRCRLQLDNIASAPAAVGGNDHLGARVLDTLLQRDRREATKYNRVDGPYPVARVHGDDHLRNERHIDDHSIAYAEPQSLERIGEPANLRMQLAITQAAHITRLPLKDQGGLVPPLRKMYVETVI